MIFTTRKNNDRKPIMANIFEKKTIYGSFEMENMAGTESTAKIKSENSTTKSTINRGVIKYFPFSFIQNFSFTKVGYTLKNLDANLTIG